MNKSQPFRYFTVLFLSVILFFSVPILKAGLVYEGTPEEQAELKKIVDDIKTNWPADAKKILDDLDKKKDDKGNPVDVKIKFGPTPDIATGDPTKNEIVLNKDAINKMKQINNPAGNGKALEQFSKPYLILHEGLHVLGNLNENDVVSKVNVIQEANGSSKRKKYEADSEDGKVTLPFDDGSKVDLTEALKEPKKEGETKKSVDTGQKAEELKMKAEQTNDTFRMSLDPGAGNQTMNLRTPFEFGGKSLDVSLLNLTANLFQAPGNTEFPLAVEDFSLSFGSFLYNGQATGINTLDLILAGRTPYGYWDYQPGDTAFSFDFSGDFLWNNDLFGQLVTQGYAVEVLKGSFYLENGQWLGTCDLEGVKFGPNTIPAPAPGMLSLLGVGLVGGYKRIRG
jgi:hypothetical protein